MADDEREPTYADYQIGLYSKAIIEKQRPILTTDPNKLRAAAKKAMRPETFFYIAGGAGEQSTMDANRLAFRQWKLIPRMLRPTSPRDLTVKLFGETYATPMILGPVGVQAAYHPDGDKGVAAVCTELGVPYTLSSAATATIEEVAEASDDGPRWFQLYWPMDDDITISLLQRAKASGYKVLVVTLDTATMSWRPSDLDRGYLPMVVGQGNAVGFSDPVFRKKFAEKFDGDTPEENPILASRYWISEAFSGDSHPWEHLNLLKKHWDGPIVLKGIQHVDDAKEALKYGVDGIIVSNHGGRQLDGAVGALEMLPEIVEAVGDKITVLFDSGIRTGGDIMKALCLGAKAVLVARPVMYGLGVAGKEGAKHIMASLLAELDGAMGLAGIKSISELDRSRLRRVLYGGDVKSNL